MAEEQFTLTQSGYDNLRHQLTELEARRAQTVPVFDDVDDDTGNLEGEEAGADYELRTRLEHIDERIGHIRFVLERAVIETEDPNPHKIDPGEEVVLWDFIDEREHTFIVLDGEEAQMTYNRLERDATIVSTESPVGKALIGAKKGDVVEVEVPDGKTRYAVRRITRPE
jgi:transcription elongation factor GreA